MIMLLNNVLNTGVLKRSNNHVYNILGIYDGYPTFVISILFIGACTAVIGDIAGHLGCFINLKDGVNAIAFVALGTSVPGTAKFSRFCALAIKSFYNCVKHTKLWQF